MKIGLLTHSVNPRGGVVHTLELADALAGLGHDVTVFAPAAPGQAFFRGTACRVSLAPVAPHGPGVPAMVQARIDAYVAHLRPLLAREDYDVLHAQDSISGNALADLAEAGDIGGFARTVHHLDDFDDARLAAWQHRAFARAAQVFCVSDTWVAHLREHHGIAAERVANGVDLRRFRPDPARVDAEVAARHGIRPGAPVFLAVGGIEARKNTLRILQAYAEVRRTHPGAQLVVAGGASLLDHDGYARAFHAALFALGPAGPGPAPVVLTGTVSDEAMAALYRLADALVMPSLREGFGLAVLEALACGTPAVVSNRRPFTEYLTAADCHFADPESVRSIAQAMRDAPGRAPEAVALLARHSWRASARRHAELYEAAQAAAF